MVQKLAALGYMPILLMGRKKKILLIADINSGIPLNEDTQPFVDAMKKAYKYLLKKQGPQMPPLHPQPDQHIQTPTQPDQQIQPHPDQQIQTQIQPDQQIPHHSDQQIQTTTQPDQQIQHHSDQQIQTQTEAQQIDDHVILNLYFLPSPSHVQTLSEAQHLQVQPQPQQIQPLTA